MSSRQRGSFITWQIYVKPNIKRRLNKKNTKYFLARKQVVGEYMDMVKKGHVVRVPDSKF